MRQAESLRTRKIKRHGALIQERSSWLTRYQQLSQYILPFSGRFFTQDRNRGDKSFNDIFDSTGTRALRILAAGMMAGMTSPARPWFRLATPDSDLMELASVKQWLNDVSELMRRIFNKSNTYRAFHSQYEELGCFATAANLIDDDFDTVLWNYTLTAGEYCIAVDRRGKPNTLYREFEMTVAQIVEQFVYGGDPKAKPDWSVVSSNIKNSWDTQKFDIWLPVLHAIEPRQLGAYDYRKRDARNMKFASCYLERNGDEEKILRESGYNEFPGTISRWHTRGQDIYGNGPGFEALGDIRQLQHEQFRKAQAIDFMAKPPIALPTDAKGNEVEYIPGGVTLTGAARAGGRAHNLVDVKMDLQHLLLDIQDVRTRINQCFYADLFLMLANQPLTGRQITAREIAERHEEKLLMLGPVLERLHDELLSPTIDITFAKIVSAGLLQGKLAPPRELDGTDLTIEFVSTLAQAQKAVGLGSLDRLLGTVTLIAQGSGDTSVWDKIDRDQVIDKYADMLAIEPSMIVSDDKIAFIRESRKQAAVAQQMAAQAQPMAQMANAVKTMGEADGEAATDNLQKVMGYTGG